MKISILGTNGFLSTAIARHAIAAGWQVDMYGLARPEGHQYDKFYEVNLMDSELDCSGLLGSDIVVYAIGAGIQANLKEGFNLIYNLNVTAPVSICNKLKELDYKGYFVTFGSYFEIGESKGKHCFTEEEILQSTYPAPNDYAVSKRMLSHFVASYKHDFTHWHFILPTIYGYGENPMRLIPYTINTIKQREQLKFTAGNQTRQYIHVSEIANIIERCSQCKLPSGIYNIEGNETKTIREIVGDIHKAMGKKMPQDCFGSIERADSGMAFLALDGTQLYNAINYKSTIRIIDCIDNYERRD